MVVIVDRRGVELAREQRMDIDAVEAAAGLELGLDLWVWSQKVVKGR